jgi:hypothetical protein
MNKTISLGAVRMAWAVQVCIVWQELPMQVLVCTWWRLSSARQAEEPCLDRNMPMSLVVYMA